MPRWMLLLLSSVARAPEGEGTGAPATDPTPSGEAAPEPTSEAKPEAVEGNGSLIPEGEAEGDATKPEPEPEAPAAAEPFDASKLTLPEGISADDPALVKLAETLADPKLTPNQRVEAILNQHGEVVKSVAEAAQAALHKNYSDMNAGWVKEVREDPEIGGAKFDSTISTIAKAIDSWSPDAKATREALAITGAGNHPAVIRTLHRMAVALGEGKPAQGSAKPPGKTAVELLYGGPAATQS